MKGIIDNSSRESETEFSEGITNFRVREAELDGATKLLIFYLSIGHTFDISIFVIFAIGTINYEYGEVISMHNCTMHWWLIIVIF